MSSIKSCGLVQVARRYSGVNEGREATIFKLLLGKKSLGADISWLSQFAGEAEMLFPPRAHLQVVGEPVLGSEGVSVVTLRPTLFQKVRTVEEVEASRKESLKQLASSVTWDLRNQAVRDGKFDSACAHQLDVLEVKLVAEYSGQAPEWYNDNNKYKERVMGLLREGTKVQTMAVLLFQDLAAMDVSAATSATGPEATGRSTSPSMSPPSTPPEATESVPNMQVVAHSNPGSRASTPPTEAAGSTTSRPSTPPEATESVQNTQATVHSNPGSRPCTPPREATESTATNIAQSSSDLTVSALHSKFAQDPNFTGFLGKFGNDELFAAGIEAVVGPMDAQYVRSMYNEHNTVTGVTALFNAWNAGNILRTCARREWLFVVGDKGLDQQTWVFDAGHALPEVAEGMMVPGRNAKHLADLLDAPEAKTALLLVPEIVALRLYTGPMYVKYNAVSRGLAKAGSTRYSATIHLIISGLQKLNCFTIPPIGLIVAMAAWPCQATFSSRTSRAFRVGWSVRSCRPRLTAASRSATRAWR